MSLKDRLIGMAGAEVLKTIWTGKWTLKSRVIVALAQREVNKMFKGSSETTTAGICAILMAVASAISLLVDGKPETNPDLASTIAAISAGIGLIRARDNNKSSEQVGANKEPK